MRRNLTFYGTKDKICGTIKDLGDGVYSTSFGEQIVRDCKKWYCVKYGAEPWYLGCSFREAVKAYVSHYDCEIPDYQMN